MHLPGLRISANEGFGEGSSPGVAVQGALSFPCPYSAWPQNELGSRCRRNLLAEVV